MSYTNMINAADNTRSHKNVKKMVYITILYSLNWNAREKS